MWSLLLTAALALPGQTAPDSVPLYDDLGDHGYEITTRDPLAQRYFDQGLRLYYAFNHQEAVRSFRAAQRRDPACAMCWWGEALAWGPNINLPMDSVAGVSAWTAVREALARRPQANEKEGALIDALALRYAEVPPRDRAALDSAWARGLVELSGRWPEDPEIAVLMGEAQMDLRPWDYWQESGEPYRGIDRALASFEEVLGRNPDHPGACHFFIHAVEKLHPERAVPCAERLADLMPGAGHIVHMPGHIYIRVGRYHDAIRLNEHAAHADETYIRDQRPPDGVYTAGYYPHNYDFLAFAASMVDEGEKALAAADKLASLIPGELMGDPGMTFLQHYATRPLQMRVRFGLWEEILEAPAPPEAHPHARAVWHYARGRALAAAGRLAEAEQEMEALGPLREAMRGVRLEFNDAGHILSVATAVLAGRLAEARGESDEAVSRLREAVRLEDELLYGEPPEWSIPVRQELGSVLLAAGRATEAAEAYREDLARFPANAWSTEGLRRALAAGGEAETRAPAEASGREAPPRPSTHEENTLFADLGSCRLEGGATLHPCRIAYRTAGRLAPDRDNVVLVPTWYGGTAASMQPFVGPGRMVDTDRHFVVMAGVLADGESSSPSNHPEGPDAFPEWSIRDLVAIHQRLLVEVLGIERPRSVVGMSMGGMQALEWAFAKPGLAERVAAVVATPRFGSWDLLFWEAQLRLLESCRPAGCPDLTGPLTLQVLSGFTPAYWLDTTPRDGLDGVRAGLAAEAATLRAEDVASQIRAMLRHDVSAPWGGELAGAARANRSSLLLLVSPGDQMVTPGETLALAELLGTPAVEIGPECGHFVWICAREEMEGRVRAFLGTEG